MARKPSGSKDGASAQVKPGEQQESGDAPEVTQNASAPAASADPSALAVEGVVDVVEQADLADVEPSAVFTHRITAAPERGFYRAGRHWLRDGTDVNRADFTDEQWAVLEAEPKLSITNL